MSDQSGNHDEPTAPVPEAGGATPPPPPPPPGPEYATPPPPPGPPPGEPTAGPAASATTLAAPPVRRSAVPRIVAAAVGVALLGGGAAFALSQAGDDGPGSPEEAVQELLDAAAAEDLLGAIAVLEPGERKTFGDPLVDAIDELKRLEVLSEDMDAESVPGIDLQFEDVTYQTEEVRDGLARVYLTGGTARSEVTGEELPIGDFVEDILDENGVDLAGADSSESTEIEEGDDDGFLAVVDTDEGWRVSLAYTIAEGARDDAGAAPLDPQEGIEPVGADSPEAAVEAMFEELAALDIEGMIARLSPEEFRVLQEYAPLFLEDAEDAAEEAAQQFTLQVDGLDLEATQEGDRALVAVNGFEIAVAAQGTEIEVRYDGECFVLGGDVSATDLGLEDERICLDDITNLASQFGGVDLSDAPQPPAADDFETGITTTQVDGQWYVAPFGTMFDSLLSALRAYDAEDLEDFKTYFEELGSFMGESGLSGGFSGVGEPVAGEDDEGLGEDDVDDEITDDVGDALTAEDEEAAYELAVELFGETEADCIFSELLQLEGTDEYDEAVLALLADASDAPPEALLSAIEACVQA